MTGETRVINVKTGTQADVYIGRPGPFGNPFQSGTRSTNIENFKRMFEDRVVVDSRYRAAVLSLRGKTLGCYCAPLPCHGDVFVQWLKENEK